MLLFIISKGFMMLFWNIATFLPILVVSIYFPVWGCKLINAIIKPAAIKLIPTLLMLLTTLIPILLYFCRSMESIMLVIRLGGASILRPILDNICFMLTILSYSCRQIKHSFKCSCIKLASDLLISPDI